MSQARNSQNLKKKKNDTRNERSHPSRWGSTSDRDTVVTNLLRWRICWGSDRSHRHSPKGSPTKPRTHEREISVASARSSLPNEANFWQRNTYFFLNKFINFLILMLIF